MFKNIKYIFIKNKLKDFVKNEQDICKRAKGKFSNDIDDNLNILDKKAKTFTTTLLNFIDKKTAKGTETAGASFASASLPKSILMEFVHLYGTEWRKINCQ